MICKSNGTEHLLDILLQSWRSWGEILGSRIYSNLGLLNCFEYTSLSNEYLDFFCFKIFEEASIWFLVIRFHLHISKITFIGLVKPNANINCAEEISQAQFSEVVQHLHRPIFVTALGANKLSTNYFLLLILLWRYLDFSSFGCSLIFYWWFSES